uniref:Uncharacterized protein n=1 Tax=Meloidogyne floridensis TaxID=298350 RepID=A0A915NYJ8_9BILA
MSTKILFFIQFIFPIFLNSLANEQESQRFKFYYYDPADVNYYKIKRININNFDLSVELECFLPEIDCSYLYIKLKTQIGFVNTNDESFAEKLNNGLTKIYFKTENNKFREGIMIGLRRAKINVVGIEPLFHKNINFEPEKATEKNKKFRLTKFEWNLNFEEGYDKLKEFIQVFAVKTNDETNFEDGQMDIIDLANSYQFLYNGTKILSLGPLFDDGSFEIYFDKNGKINDLLLLNRMFLKNSKNILKDYLIKRELGNKKKNVFNKDEQIWFRYMEDLIQKNFKNENGKSKIIEVYKF